MDDAVVAPIVPGQQHLEASDTTTPPPTMLSSKEPLYDPDSYYFVQPNVSGFFQTEQPTWSWPPLPTPAPSPIDTTRAPHSISTMKPNTNATTPTNGSNNANNSNTNSTISDDMLAIYQPIPSSAVIRSVGTVLLLSMVAIYLLLILLARRRRRRLDAHAEQRRKRKHRQLPDSPSHIQASLTQATDASSPDLSEKRGNVGATSAKDNDSVRPTELQETDVIESGVSPARLDFAVPDGN